MGETLVSVCCIIILVMVFAFVCMGIHLLMQEYIEYNQKEKDNENSESDSNPEGER